VATAMRLAYRPIQLFMVRGPMNRGNDTENLSRARGKAWLQKTARRGASLRCGEDAGWREMHSLVCEARLKHGGLLGMRACSTLDASWRGMF
jgi:hypothetical protein